MKHLKILGLAVVAAMALAAFAGASTASATELCSTNTSPCTGTKYGSGTTVHTVLKSSTVATLTNPITNVTCTESTTHGTTTNAGGKGVAVTGKITTFTFGGCKTSGGTPCTVTSVNVGTGYNASIAATGGGNGTLTVTSSNVGNPGAKVECGILINCTFTTASAALGVTGGNPAIAKANAIPLLRAGGFCPSEAKWDAEYEVLQPKPLFIVNP